ncbi:MAG: hypothetical protein ACTSWY_09525 [Promethearchaeota archaeon]
MNRKKYNNFRPFSKKTRLKLNNKPKTSTIFMYQKGYINNKIALRLINKKTEKVFKTLVSSNKSSWGKNPEKKDTEKEIWDIIEKLGGQSREKAQIQREERLTWIVSNYFKKLGYEIEEQPKLKENTPDLLITKKDENGKEIHSCYIELKAYFGETIVGEAEVAQILKYYAIVKNTPELSSQKNHTKFMLITSGKLISLQNNAFFNGNLQKMDTENKKIKFIRKKYKIHLKKLGWPNNMEGQDTRNIYRFAHKKIKKYSLGLQLNQSPKVIQPVNQENSGRLEKLIENNEYDLILVPAETFSNRLYLSGLKTEQKIFNQIRKLWLERLIFNKRILYT